MAALKPVGCKLRPGLILAGVLLFSPLAAIAQVIEIAPDGAVTTYDGPMAIAEDGAATPLRPAPTVRRRNRPAAPGEGMAMAASAAQANNLSPELVQAVAWRESRFHPGVVSPTGAVGEMQLMPQTARRLGVDPYDSRQNFWGGANYLSGLMRRYDGNLVLALAAYNAGPGAVDKYGGVPPYRETRNYVADVLNHLSARAAPITPSVASSTAFPLNGQASGGPAGHIGR